MISVLKKNLAVWLLFLCVITICPQTIYASNEISRHETLRVGFFAMDGYHMIDENGNKSGYGYDFLRLMARYLDVEYEYIGYDKSWHDMFQMLENDQIDMVTSVRKTPERKAKFDFSRPIGTNECMLTVRSDNTSVVVQKYSTYDGLRVGFLNGNTRNTDFDAFAKDKGFTYVPVCFDMVSHMESALQSGKIDAIVSGSMRATANERVIETFESEEIYAIVKKGNTELLDKINYAIDQMNESEGAWKTELFNRYYTLYDDKILKFTDKEKEIIEQYSSKDTPLLVLCDPTKKPYSYVEDGQMKGILPDYFRKLSDNIGISCQFIICNSREEYIAVHNNKELVDLAIDVRLEGDNLAEAKHLGITAPYISISVAKVVRRDFNGTINTVATVEQGASGALEDIYAPDTKKIIYETRYDAMQAVKDGKADAAFVFYYMAQEFVNNDPSGSLVCNLLDKSAFQYRIVTASHINHALSGILTKAIYAMPDKTIEDIASGYTSYKVSDMSLKTIVQLHPVVTLVFTAIMALLFIILAILTVKIRRKNDKLNDSLSKISRDKHVLDKLCVDYTAVYYIDLISGGFETLKMAKNANGEKLLKEKSYKNFDEYALQYSREYISNEDKEEFENWFSCANLKKLLSQADRASFHYKCIPNINGQKFFASQAVQVYRSQDKFYVLLGFRYIDDIMQKEKEIQYQLQQALDEAKLQNEIISAISKSYHSIYRIDLQRDFFEEISNDDETHRLTGNKGCASEKLYQICDTMITPEYRPLVRPFMDISTVAERLKKEEYISTEYRMCNGNWHSLRFIAKKRDSSGMVTHVLCTVRSISDTKRREQDLLFAADAAQREADMKTQFLATMSHDIRTPLNGIIGLINMANHYDQDPEMQQKIRDKIMNVLKYLVSLVNDILDMNKLQSGEIKEQEITFDIVDLIRKVNRIYAQKAAEKGITYKTDWKKDSIKHPYLIGNPVYLGRIISNIADNAVKFSSPNSTITVWGNEEALDDERVVFNLYCKDQGTGMSEEFIKHAFDMFSQENASSRSHYEGTGLGLAIAKKLADSMKGSIELQSEVGVGTTVHITLPFKIGNPDTLHKAESIDDISVEGVHALVVEDNELNMEIAACMLEGNGMKVSCATNGLEAVQLFEESAPGYFEVIYMDIMMPKMNGLDAATAIRNLDREDAESVPIIAMSANAFAEDIINCKLAGMNMHLSKPLDETKMITALKQCMADNKSLKLRDDL